MRFTRQPGAPPTKYAIPVSHSHQLLCVSWRPVTTAVIRLGFVGSVTSHSSCPLPPKLRNRYVLLLSARGSSFPSHTRTIWAPPDSPTAPGVGGSPGICDRYFGCLGSVTSTIEVPLNSSFPVR